MKKLFVIYLFGISIFTNAQKEFKCGQQFANEYLFKKGLFTKDKFNKLLFESDENNSNSKLLKSTTTSFTIPVVFHVLHLGGVENISDAQINDAVTILNRDFQKKNADTANITPQFKGIAADCNIEFKLATLDENGNCTNGITRHYTNKTNWTTDFNNYVYTWDRTKYLNVYVVKTLEDGVAGYTFLPGMVGSQQDAIVILHGYVGSIGTSNVFTSRALTHEVGHWFNLQHTWGSTNNPGVACGDDGVNDTPITKGHYNCNLTSAVCTSSIVENVQNYMEYAYCSKMYTQGQKTRIHTCINSGIAGRNNLSTTTNLIATGVINPTSNCGPKAEFTSNLISCVGNSVTFTDYSYNGSVTNWQWTSPLAANTSTIQNGILSFTNSGIASVKLKVSNSFGSDSITEKTLIILPGQNSGTLNITQSFETTFPDNNWIATLPQYGTGFVTNTTTAATGTNCIWVNNFYDTPNEAVTFFTPMYNLQNAISPPQLSFKYAYSQKSTSDSDTLNVWGSNNCGANWTLLYSKSGSQLNSTNSLNTNSYVSPITSDWKTESVNLSLYGGYPKVALKFEFIPSSTSPGNNLFMDDINLNGIVNVKSTNPEWNNYITIFPNPTKSLLTIKFDQFNLNNNDERVTFQVVNALGNVMKEGIILGKTTTLNLQDLASGIYILKINSSDSYKTFKVIKE